MDTIILNMKLVDIYVDIYVLQDGFTVGKNDLLEEKDRVPFFERALDVYLKEHFLDGLKVLFTRYLGYTFAVILSISLIIISSFLIFTPIGISFHITNCFFLGVLFSLIFTGFISLLTPSSRVRNAFFYILSFLSFAIILFASSVIPNLITLQFIFIITPMVIISIGLVVMGFYLIIHEFQVSWIARVSSMGKPNNKIMFQKEIQTIALISIFFPLYIFFRYLTSGFVEFLALGVIGLITYFMILLITLNKSWYHKYKSFDFFSFSVVSCYLLVYLLFFLFFFSIDVITLVTIMALTAVVIIALAQAINPKNKMITRHEIFEKEELDGLKRIFLEKRKQEEAFYSKKDDEDVIIINIEDDESKPTRPKKKSKQKSMRSIQKKFFRRRDALMSWFLAIFLGTFYFFYQNLSPFIVIYFYVPIPLLNFGMMNSSQYTTWLAFFTLIFVIIIVMAYFSSARVQSWTANKITQNNAFLEFLSLIDKDERRKLLVNMADTAREILISGIIDLFDPAAEKRSNLGDTIKDGIEFVKRFFKGGEEEV